MKPLILDTHIALDLLVFADPAMRPLAQALAHPAQAWLATPAMRAELARVLDYPRIATRLQRLDCAAADVLTRFDNLVRRAAPAPPAPVRCTDRDDQMFIDLAVAHGGVLLSRDKAVLRLRARLARLAVQVAPAWPATQA